MNSSRKAFVLSFSIILLASITAHAIIWPVQDTGRKGIMSLYGDYRSEDVGCNFHGGIDITQNVENNATDNCEVPVLCALDSTFVCYMVSNPGKKIQLEDIEGIILKSSGVYYWYMHLKGIKPHEIQRGPNWQTFSEGQQLGFIAEESDPAYGGSSAHMHFVPIGGTMYEGLGLDFEEVELSIPGPNMKILAFAGFKPPTMAYWPLENPLNILPDADTQDTEPPIFINSVVSGTPIDIVPNLVWIDTGTSSATHENGYVDKTECPWVVRGKVDIIARVNDYMNVKGYAHPPLDTDMLPGIYEIKYEILDGATPLMVRNLVWDDLPNSNFNGLLPGGEIAKNRFKKGMYMHPFIMNSSQFGQIFSEGYDHIRYNHNYYVVSNTTGSEIDMNSALDTSTIPEGTYTIRVTARDHAGNSSYVDFNVEIKHADIYVDGSSNRQPENGSADNPYRNIGTALNAASYGDTVFVAPGTYTNEAFPLNIPNGVSVVGSGAASTTVYGDGTHGIFRFEDTYSDTQLSEFKIQNAGTGFDNAAIYIRNSQGVVSNCHITGNAGLAIHAQDCQYHPVHSFKIVNNVLNGNYDGIYNHSCASALRIENTTIDGAYIAVNNFNWCSPLITNSILATNTYAVMASNNSDPTISFSCVNSSYVDYDWDYSSSITRIGNFGGIPYYESGPYGSYYLNPISNCINYGLDSNVTFPDIYTRTTQAVSTPLPSGYYD